MDGSKIILHLIHITINTLNAQYHSCRPHATAGPLYSDNSNMSRYSEKEKGELSFLLLITSEPEGVVTYGAGFWREDDTAIDVPHSKCTLH